MSSLSFSPLFILSLLLTAEYILSIYWAPFYFKFGISFFNQSIKYQSDNELTSIDTPQLTKHFEKSIYQSMIFKHHGNHHIFFREQLTYSIFMLQYIPTFHGLIKIDTKTNTIKVKGMLNWFIPLFPLVIIWIINPFQFAFTDPLFYTPLLLLVPLIGGIFIQLRRYKIIAVLLRAQLKTANDTAFGKPLEVDDFELD